ncbi:MAG: class I tRNA ligase family protein, partial [Acidobacteriota bacterium]|nr:class I tRNA ligase family protein [Acidobacteriota bacterium]
EDVKLSDVILTRLSEAYKKLRNSGFRYMLGNLHDFDPAADSVPGEALLSVDTWVLIRAEELARRCTGWYAEYSFHRVYRAIYDFVITDLSAIYFDVLKDRLYTSGTRSQARRSAQTALYRINSALVRLLAPILSYTAEEVWQHMKTHTAGVESVHLDEFPEAGTLTSGITADQRARAADWDQLLPVRDIVLKSLDTAREDKVIGSSLEAAVFLEAGDDVYPLLWKHEAELEGWFIVSQVELKAGGAGLAVRIDRARGDKCERCWKYTTDVGSHPDFPTVCAACAKVLPDFVA